MRHTTSRPSRLAALLAMAACTLAPARSGAGAAQCANLVYAGTQTSRCFSDEFLSAVQRETTIATERRFTSVKLASDELFGFPFVVMTGERDFHLSSTERDNLARYLRGGGFLLASAGCSSKEFDRAFRRELRTALPDVALAAIPREHAIFRTVYKVGKLGLKHPAGEPRLEGVELGGRMVLVYSRHGLNDTSHTQGCCCCGGNEITNSLEVNVNIVAYALLH